MLYTLNSAVLNYISIKLEEKKKKRNCGEKERGPAPQYPVIRCRHWCTISRLWPSM